MPDVEISYKGSQIASMSASGVKTLLTGDSFCEDDIVVSYTKPSAPTPTLQSKTVSPSTSRQTVTPDSGYDGLSSVTVNAMPTGTAGTPSATKGTVSNHSVSVTPSVTNTTGYITGGTKNGVAVTVTAEELASGTKNITENGEGIDVVGYLDVDVNVTPTLQTKSVTPTESAQTVTPDSGYDGLSQVNVARIPTNYIVPSGTKSITENGTGIDVANYASVDVNVSGGGGGTTHVSGTSIPGTKCCYQAPSGAITIIEPDPIMSGADIDVLSGSMLIVFSGTNKVKSLSNATYSSTLSLGSRASYPYAMLYRVS